jgi:hypothetical protein
LLDERQVAHPDEQQDGKDDEADDDFRQLAPDAQVNIHGGELSTRTGRTKADFIVSPRGNGYHCARMIKALFLIFEPVTAWSRVLEARRSVLFIFATYLLPMLLLVAVTGGFGLTHGGKWQPGIGQYKKFTVGEAVVYETGELLLMLVVIAVCAHLIKLMGETFNGRHTYAQAFTVMIYGLSPMFLARLLDALPSANLWLTWIIGILLTVKILYHGLPIIMRPEPSHALGLYFMSSLLIVAITGLERLAMFLALSGKSQSLSDFVYRLAAKLPF